MASSPTPSLRAEMQGLGENTNTWGYTKLNEALSRLDEGQAKVVTLTITGNYSLTATNYVASEATSFVLRLNGSPGATYKVTVPSVSKPYLVYNNTNATQTIGTASGTAASVRAGMICMVYCDGTDAFVQDPRLDQIKTPTANVAMGGYKITGLAAPAANGDAARYDEIQALYAYAAGIANSGILAPGTVTGQFLQWNGTAWAQAAIPPLIAGTDTTVTGSFTAGTMAVNVTTGTGASVIPKRDANGRIANLIAPWVFTSTTPYNAVNGEQIVVDSSGGAKTVNLPASPVVGDQVVIARSGGSAVTIGRNSSTIAGLSEDHSLDTNYALVTAICTAATTWKLIPGMLR